MHIPGITNVFHVAARRIGNLVPKRVHQEDENLPEPPPRKQYVGAALAELHNQILAKTEDDPAYFVEIKGPALRQRLDTALVLLNEHWEVLNPAPIREPGAPKVIRPDRYNSNASGRLYIRERKISAYHGDDGDNSNIRTYVAVFADEPLDKIAQLDKINVAVMVLYTDDNNGLKLSNVTTLDKIAEQERILYIVPTGDWRLGQVKSRVKTLDPKAIMQAAYSGSVRKVPDVQQIPAAVAA